MANIDTYNLLNSGEIPTTKGSSEFSAPNCFPFLRLWDDDDDRYKIQSTKRNTPPLNIAEMLN